MKSLSHPLSTLNKLLPLIAMLSLSAILAACSGLPSNKPVTSPLASPVESPGSAALAQANALLASRSYVEALAQFDELIRNGQELDRAYAGRGYVMAALFRFDEAIDSYTKALTSKPTGPVYAARCAAYRSRAKLDLAAVDCQKAKELGPYDPNAFVAMAALRLAQGNPTEALNEIDGALKLDNRSTSAYYAQAQIYEAEHNYPAKVQALSKCIEYNANELLCYYERAVAYIQVGNIDASRADLRTVLKLGKAPADGELMYRASGVLNSIGNK